MDSLNQDQLNQLDNVYQQIILKISNFYNTNFDGIVDQEGDNLYSPDCIIDLYIDPCYMAPQVFQCDCVMRDEPCRYCKDQLIACDYSLNHFPGSNYKEILSKNIFKL